MAMASSLMKTLKFRSLKLVTTTVATRNLSSFINEISKHTAESVTHTRKESPMELKASSTIIRCCHTIAGDTNSRKPHKGSYADKWKPEQHSENESESDGDFISFSEEDRCWEDDEDEFSERREKGGIVSDGYDCRNAGEITAGDVDCPKAIDSAQFAISFLDNNVEFVKLVRVNWELFNGVIYYLTIEASDKNFYEAKVSLKPGPRRRKALFFIRPARSQPSGQS